MIYPHSDLSLWGVNKPVIWVGEKPTLSRVKSYIGYANLLGYNFPKDCQFDIIKFNLPVTNEDTISLALQKVEADYKKSPFIAWPEGCAFIR